MFNIIQTAYAQAQGVVVETAQDETIGAILFSVFDVLKNVFIAILLLIASFLFAKVLSHYIVSKLRDTQGETLHEDVVILVKRMTTVGVVAIGMAIAFEYVLGFDILQLIGFFGLGVGFAFKDLLANLLAGVIILMQGRFHIGDFIKIGENKGKVIEIQTRSTILKGLDGTEIIIPNANFLSKTVTSYTTNPTRRVQLAVGVHYKTDLELATKIIEDTMKQNQNILPEPEAKVIATEFGDSAIMLDVRFWVASKDGISWIVVRSEVVHLIKKAFEEHGITIPFPIRTVHQGTEQDGLGWEGVAQVAPEVTEVPEAPQQPAEGVQTAAPAPDVQGAA
jgi:small-conductance mechanosensitive channel